MQKDEVWLSVLENLRTILPETVIRAWFDDTTVTFFDENKIIIAAPSDFKRDALIKRYEGSIARALFHIFDKSYKVEVITRTEKETKDVSVEHIENYLFENFVVGPTNQFAYSASFSISERLDSAKGYNPLFIYGGSGLGKTHLLYAIRNYVKAKKPDSNIVIISAEQFFLGLVRAIESGNRLAFQNKHRNADMLLVDDSQFIAKEFVQEEFFHTFNALHETGRQIVLTSDRPPRDMKKLEDRLRSRFEWGLVVDIQPPDLETRMAILRAKASRLGFTLPDSVSEHIAETITANVRQLEGTIKKLYAYHDLMGYSLNIDTAGLAIADLMKENPGLNPKPDFILERVCQFYGVEVEDVLSSSRRAVLVMARQTSMFLMRELSNKSYQEIADFLNRDHSTVIHAINRLTEQKNSSEDFKNDLRIITDNIRSE